MHILKKKSDDLTESEVIENLKTWNFNHSEIDRTIHVGTPAFLAPELLMKLVKQKGVRLKAYKNRKDPLLMCDYATDVYSFGMCLWQILTMKMPYENYKPLDMVKLIQKGNCFSIKILYLFYFFFAFL